MSTNEVSERVALITGGGRGIGLSLARKLAVQGVRTVIGVRDVDRAICDLDALGGAQEITVLPLDVTDQASILAARDQITAQFGTLHLLVNNAAINAPGQLPSDAELSTIRELFEVNVFGVVSVTNLMLPLLRHGQSAQIVNVSSHKGSMGFNGFKGPMLGAQSMLYSTSKTALNALTRHYAAELRDTNIKVNAVAPGLCATSFNNFAGTRTADDGANVILALIMLGNVVANGDFYDENGVIPW